MAEDNTPSRYDSIPVLLKKILRTLRAKDFDYSFETNNGSTYADLLSKIGVFAYDNATGLPGITSLTFNKMVSNREGIDLENMPDLTALSFPVLESIVEGGYFNISGSLQLATCLFPALVSVSGDFSISDSLVNELLFPNLTTARHFGFAGNALLSTIYFPNLASLTDGGNIFRADGCAFTAATVNHILARLLVCGLTFGVVDLSGGTSEAPTGQGIIDKAALIAQGLVVTTN